MKVVVVGSRDWSGTWAEKQVNDKLDELLQKYVGMKIMSSSCDKGVGLIVKNRCLADNTTFQFIDIHARVYAKLTKAEMTQLFFARNCALAEWGEEFHVFVDETRRGAMEDLVERVAAMNRPHFEYLPKRGGV